MGGPGKHTSGTLMSSNDLVTHQTHKNGRRLKTFQGGGLPNYVSVKLFVMKFDKGYDTLALLCLGHVCI